MGLQLFLWCDLPSPLSPPLPVAVMAPTAAARLSIVPPPGMSAGGAPPPRRGRRHPWGGIPLACCPQSPVGGGARLRGLLLTKATTGGDAGVHVHVKAGGSGSPVGGAPAAAVAPGLTPTGTFQVGLLAGAVAGTAVDVVLFPLDTFKTRVQAAGTAAVARAQLLRGLYAGIAPAVVASAPAAAAFFGTYDALKRVLADTIPDGHGRYAPVAHMLAAAGGDVASSTVRAPFEVVKQRLQAGMHASSGDAIRSVWRTSGFRGFYAGYGSLVLRELPFDALQFPLYEALKSRWAARRAASGHPDGGRLQTWQTSACGSAAGAVSAAVTTPLDVVKTRMMTQAAGTVPYKGAVDGLSRIAREEGVAALTAGLVPRVVWIALGGAIFFGGYEVTKAHLTPKVLRMEQRRREEGRAFKL